MFVISLIIGFITYIIHNKCYDIYMYDFDYIFDLPLEKRKEEQQKIRKRKKKYGAIGSICEVISYFMFIVATFSSIIGFILLGFGTYSKMIIPVYEEENAKIERQVSEFVSKYTDYEKDAFKDLKPETMQIMIMTYPELKTNELISKQIDIYVSNNDKLKKLKEESNQYKIGKWLLYFG